MSLTLEEKLERKFEASRFHSFCRPGRRVAFVWCSSAAANGTRYGSYKNVYEDELALRQYVLEDCDYSVAVFYTDVVYDPRSRKNDPKA